MPIKIAIVGTGSVARNSYLPYLSKQKDVVLTYYSRTRSKAEECVSAFGGRIANSIRELLADEPDAVLVLTRETERFEATLALLEGRPKRFFFEKPLVAQNGQAKVSEDDFFKAVSPTRLAMAKKLGASDVVNAKEVDSVTHVRALTGSAGADACIEAAGRPETALACFAAVRTAGTVVFNGEQGALPISPSDQFIRRDITAVGAWFYHFSEFGPMLDLYRNGLRVLDLISHRYPIGEANAAFEKFASGQSGKVLLVYQ